MVHPPETVLLDMPAPLQSGGGRTVDVARREHSSHYATVRALRHPLISR
jgi:hypothetical protein